jgi:hypothetical protein
VQDERLDVREAAQNGGMAVAIVGDESRRIGSASSVADEVGHLGLAPKPGGELALRVKFHKHFF